MHASQTRNICLYISSNEGEGGRGEIGRNNHSLLFVVTRCTTCSHSLYHSLSFVVTGCHSLSLVVPLVVTRCHSMCQSLVCLFINDQRKDLKQLLIGNKNIFHHFLKALIEANRTNFFGGLYSYFDVSSCYINFTLSSSGFELA